MNSVELYSQAVYLVLVEIQGAKGIPASEMLWYNSISSLPILVLLTWVGGEGASVRRLFAAAAAKHGAGGTLTAVVLCSTGGIVLNFSMFLATVVGSVSVARSNGAWGGGMGRWPSWGNILASGGTWGNIMGGRGSWGQRCLAGGLGAGVGGVDA